MVEFLPFYFFYSLLFQLSSVDMYISTVHSVTMMYRHCSCTTSLKNIIRKRK